MHRIYGSNKNEIRSKRKNDRENMLVLHISKFPVFNNFRSIISHSTSRISLDSLGVQKQPNHILHTLSKILSNPTTGLSVFYSLPPKTMTSQNWRHDLYCVILLTIIPLLVRMQSHTFRIISSRLCTFVHFFFGALLDGKRQTDEIS